MSMHYGSSGSKNTRLYTPSIGTRRLGEAVGTLPNLVWRTQGATGGRARPTSGLKLTITHVDVPSAPSRQSHRSEATSWRPATQLRSRLNSRRGHDVRHTVPQKRQTSELLPSLPSTPGPSAPVTLPPIASKAEDEHPALDMDDGESSSPPPEENDNKSESESEVYISYLMLTMP